MSSTPETFTAPPRTGPARRVTKDAVLEGAVEVARAAAATEAGEHLGEHLTFQLEAERQGTHYFATTAPGYVGWRWFVTLTRAPRSRTPIVAEAGLLPGEDALLAPAWVPWADRLAPGDLGATDRLPYSRDDERLETGYVATGDEEIDRIAIHELGLGRDRVMNAKALDAAATRWYHSDRGPDSAGSRRAGADCATCGFIVPLAGSLGTLFGVCANEWSPDDGKVVSLDHGCGAHSETDVRRTGGEWDQSAPHLDDLELEVVQAVERSRAEDDDGAEAGDGDGGDNSSTGDGAVEASASDDDGEAPVAENGAVAKDPGEEGPTADNAGDGEAAVAENAADGATADGPASGSSQQSDEEQSGEKVTDGADAAVEGTEAEGKAEDDDAANAKE